MVICMVSEVFLGYLHQQINEHIFISSTVWNSFYLGSGGSPVLAPKSSATPSDKGTVPLKLNLLQFRKNVSDLRMQLHQMRQLQARPLTF